MSKINNIKKVIKDMNVFRNDFRIRQEVSDEIKKNVVPQERISLLKPNRENQRGIPQKNLWESPIPRETQFGTKRK